MRGGGGRGGGHGAGVAPRPRPGRQGKARQGLVREGWQVIVFWCVLSHTHTHTHTTAST